MSEAAKDHGHTHDSDVTAVFPSDQHHELFVSAREAFARLDRAVLAINEFIGPLLANELVRRIVAVGDHMQMMEERLSAAPVNVAAVNVGVPCDHDTGHLEDRIRGLEQELAQEQLRSEDLHQQLMASQEARLSENVLPPEKLSRKAPAKKAARARKATR